MADLNPTEEEFRAAREQSEYDGETGEDAYQVCRLFRGQMFLRERAERWLNAHRSRHRELSSAAMVIDLMLDDDQFHRQ